MVAVTHSRVVVIRVSRVPNSRGQRQHVNLGFRFFFCSCKANLWVDADMEGAVYQEQCLLQVCRDTTKIDH